jgi:hypothetical protein
MNEGPLVEMNPINDLFAEDVGRLEVMGDHVRVVYWRWRQDAGLWRRVALDWAMVLPLRSFRLPIEMWSGVQIVRSPPGIARRLH